ncbi:ALP1-like protein isoform X1 [Tanacetum coccineum]
MSRVVMSRIYLSVGHEPENWSPSVLNTPTENRTLCAKFKIDTPSGTETLFVLDPDPKADPQKPKPVTEVDLHVKTQSELEYLRKPTQTDIEKLYAFLEEKHGLPGANNDINVIRQSSLLNDLKEKKSPEVAFVANNMHYKWGYLKQP